MPIYVEAKEENCINIAPLKLKKQSINQRLSKLTDPSALQPSLKSTYKVHFQSLTKFFKLVGDEESTLIL